MQASIGRLIEGRNFDVGGIRRDKEDALMTALTNSILVALDNVDSQIEWLENFLARYATGFKRKERKLHTNKDQVAYNADGILMLTTRSCHFKREDVVKRLLLLYFSKEPDYMSDAKLYKELDRRRPAILGELLTQLGMIADYIAEHGDEETESLKFRMSDFADFGMLVASAPGGMGATAWKALIGRLGDSQNDFTAEDDTLLILLGQLLNNEQIDGSPVSTWGKIGPVRSSELYSFLVMMAKDQAMTIPAKSPATFGQLLTNKRRMIESKLGVEVMDERRHAGERWVTFKRKAKPGDGGDGGGDGAGDAPKKPKKRSRRQKADVTGGGGDAYKFDPRNVYIDVTQQSPTEFPAVTSASPDAPPSPSPVTSNVRDTGVFEGVLPSPSPPPQELRGKRPPTGSLRLANRTTLKMVKF